MLCKDSSVSESHYHVRNLILQTIPSLNNAGDGIGLYDNMGNLLDTVNYLPSYGGNGGRSLERIDFLSGNDSTNWSECLDTTGATPGEENSIAILPFDAALKKLGIPASTMKPGETTTLFVVVVNRGRNPAANISVSVSVLRALDSQIVYTETRRIDRALLPKDSTAEVFGFSPEKSGLHTISAVVKLENDSRFRNDTLSARMNVGYAPLSIVINEIMYTKGAMGEYFEIFNQSQSPIDLSGWTFHISSSQARLFRYSAIPLFLPPSSYYVVAGDSSIMSQVSDTSMVVIARSLSLRDDGDCVVIADPAGNVVDSVYYQPSWHNSDIARTSGRSLEKINPSLPSNERTSWSTSVAQSGGTPGAKNSLFVNPGQTANAISVAPNPFSPDGDGHDDFTFISYSYPVTSVKVRIRIFDSSGRLIATPADNIVLPSTGRLVWDGRDGSGKIVRFGLYILFVEVTGPDGKSLSTFKAPLVVAKRMR